MLESPVLRAAPAPHVEEFRGELVDVADARLGSTVVAISDEWFAPCERMLNPRPPVYFEDKFDDHGQWMDGWETRRLRGSGHDWAIVRLPRPALASKVDLDTTFFMGNHPVQASIEGCVCDERVPGAEVRWRTLLAPHPLAGDCHNLFELGADRCVVTHVRLNIFPDGGLARFRLFGRFSVDWSAESDECDLAAAVNGARVIAWNDARWGSIQSILMPGRGVDMGDGWETRRRREPGYDWAVIELAHPGHVRRLLIDTAHFKGNFPELCSVEGVLQSPDAGPVSESTAWMTVLAPSPMRADAVHEFSTPASSGPFSHLRLCLHPDGGISRFRAYGIVA